MDQMADEMTLRADVKDKGRVNTAEESSAWARGERIESQAQVSNWGLGALADTEPGETSRDSGAQRPQECDSSSSPQFSLKMYLRRSSSAASCAADSLSSSSQQSNVGVDCAGIVLNCLFCRFYDANQCCPNYKQVVTPAESSSSSSEDLCLDWDCGMCSCGQDTGDCLELAMEISELCYH